MVIFFTSTTRGNVFFYLCILVTTTWGRSKAPPLFFYLYIRRDHKVRSKAIYLLHNNHQRNFVPLFSHVYLFHSSHQGEFLSFFFFGCFIHNSHQWELCSPLSFLFVCCLCSPLLSYLSFSQQPPLMSVFFLIAIARELCSLLLFWSLFSQQLSVGGTLFPPSLMFVFFKIIIGERFAPSFSHVRFLVHSSHWGELCSPPFFWLLFP